MEIFLSLLFVNNDLYVCFIRAPRSIIIIGPVYLPTTRRQIKVAPLFCSATVKVTVFTPPRKAQRGGVRIELNIHIFGNGKWTYHIQNFQRTNFSQALLDWLTCVFVIHLLFIRSNKSICKCDQKLFNYVCMTGIYIVSWPFKTRGWFHRPAQETTAWWCPAAGANFASWVFFANENLCSKLLKQFITIFSWKRTRILSLAYSNSKGLEWGKGDWQLQQNCYIN